MPETPPVGDPTARPDPAPESVVATAAMDRFLHDPDLHYRTVFAAQVVEQAERRAGATISTVERIAIRQGALVALHLMDVAAAGEPVPGWLRA